MSDTSVIEEAGPPVRSPAHFGRRLLLAAVIGPLAAFVVIAVGLDRVMSDFVVASAEADAVRVSRGIVSSQGEELLSEGPHHRLVLDIGPEIAPALDVAFEGFAASFDIVKVKLYSPEGRIAYSTDSAIIGLVDEDNERLAEALDGRVSSKVEGKEAVVDLLDETRFSVDVVETYVPIYNRQAEVVGVFEIYQDSTRYAADERTMYYYALALVGACLAAVAGSTYLLMRRGSLPGTPGSEA